MSRELFRSFNPVICSSSSFYSSPSSPLFTLPSSPSLPIPSLAFTGLVILIQLVLVISHIVISQKKNRSNSIQYKCGSHCRGKVGTPARLTWWTRAGRYRVASVLWVGVSVVSSYGVGAAFLPVAGKEGWALHLVWYVQSWVILLNRTASMWDKRETINYCHILNHLVQDTGKWERWRTLQMFLKLMKSLM